MADARERGMSRSMLGHYSNTRKTIEAHCSRWPTGTRAWISGLLPKDHEERLCTEEKGGGGGKEEGTEASVSSGGEQRVTRGSILYRGRDPLLVARCSTLSAALPFASPRRGCQ